MERTYYEILRVPADSTQKEIETAYKNLAKRLHPDKTASIVQRVFPDLKGEELKEKIKNEEKELQRIFTEITEAYNVLSDPKKRQNYDLYGEYGEAQSKNPPIEVIAAKRFKELLLKAMIEIDSPEHRNIVSHIQKVMDHVKKSVKNQKEEVIENVRKLMKVKKRLSGPEKGLHLEVFKEEMQKFRQTIKDCKYQKELAEAVEAILHQYSYAVDEVPQQRSFRFDPDNRGYPPNFFG